MEKLTTRDGLLYNGKQRQLGVSEADAIANSLGFVCAERLVKHLECQDRWIESLKQLVGRRIAIVRYLNPEEQKALGWSSSSVLLILDDGTLLFPSTDDEGNDAGALFIQKGKRTPTLPEVAPII